MCLILFALNLHPDYRLILAANRDEYYDRPTQALAFWDDGSEILAGRDLEANGTWLGITPGGHFAALTNFRSSIAPITNAPSRGLLVSNFLAEKESPKQYLKRIETVGHSYNGFNLLVGDRKSLFYYSNRGSGIQHLESGIYGVSTCLLGTQWPKIVKGKDGLATLISKKSEIHSEDLFSILMDRSYPPDDELPQTGIDRNWERILSPLFIVNEAYGTRSSTAILVNRIGKVTIAERTFVPKSEESTAHETREFTFMLSNYRKQ